MAGLLSLWEKSAKKSQNCSAVIVAAGSARRMEGIDKVLAKLGELPVLVHTLYAFQDCPAINEVVVVTREDLLMEVGHLCKEYNLDKVKKIIVGGAERINSVRAGLNEISPEADLVAIHDGARPLVTQKILTETVARAAATGAAAPAIPVIDTIKRSEDGFTVETVDRSSLRAMQTPQIFEAGLIRTALEKALEDGENLTDDCAAVERLGMKVALTEGSRENIKITTPFDLMLGESILKTRVRGTV